MKNLKLFNTIPQHVQIILQGDWPWKAELKGRCTCENGFYFDHDTGSCTSGMTWWLVVILVIAVLVGVAGGVVGCCSCFGKCRQNESNQKD